MVVKDTVWIVQVLIWPLSHICWSGGPFRIPSVKLNPDLSFFKCCCADFSVKILEFQDQERSIVVISDTINNATNFKNKSIKQAIIKINEKVSSHETTYERRKNAQVTFVHL